MTLVSLDLKIIEQIKQKNNSNMLKQWSLVDSTKTALSPAEPDGLARVDPSYFPSSRWDLIQLPLAAFERLGSLK